MLTKVEDSTSFEDQALSGDDSLFQRSRCSLVDNLITCLDRRFADLSDGVIQATQLVDFKYWPDKQDMTGKLTA
tara:strand:- start:99 stop:320 length:222 start_codon:yes stop_codon:yes gene_type:complete